MACRLRHDAALLDWRAQSKRSRLQVSGARGLFSAMVIYSLDGVKLKYSLMIARPTSDAAVIWLEDCDSKQRWCALEVEVCISTCVH